MKKALTALIVAFCALLFGVIAGVSRLVERKESRQKMQPFLPRVPSRLGQDIPPFKATR